MYEQIMVPLDGSPQALAAVPHALHLARCDDAELLLVEAISFPAESLVAAPVMFPAARPVSPETAEDLSAAAEEAALDRLRHVEQRIRARGFDGTIRVRALVGDAGSAICAAARDEDVDAIVMATRGRGGVARAVLGSVADHVARNTEGIPVLLVDDEPDD